MPKGKEYKYYDWPVNNSREGVQEKYQGGGRVSSSSAGSNIKKTKKGYEVEQVIKADTKEGKRYYKGKGQSRSKHMAGEIADARAKTKVHSAPADSLTTEQYKTNWDSKTGRKKGILRKTTDKLGITKKQKGGKVKKKK